MPGDGSASSLEPASLGTAPLQGRWPGRRETRPNWEGILELRRGPFIAREAVLRELGLKAKDMSPDDATTINRVWERACSS